MAGTAPVWRSKQVQCVRAKEVFGKQKKEKILQMPAEVKQCSDLK